MTLSRADKKGLFVVFEGTDGAGTTTQCRRLLRALRRRGDKALATYEPSSLRVGRYTREALKQQPGPSPERMALLFAADRLDHFEKQIGPALVDGSVVISDRYVMSSLAYQGVECDAEWVATINRYAPMPELTIFLDIDEKEAARRRQKRNLAADRYEQSPTQRLVAKRYRQLVQDLPQDKVLILSGAESMTEIHEKIMVAVDSRLRKI